MCFLAVCVRRFSVFNFIFIAVIVMYAYACVGVSLMHGHLGARHLYDGDPGETYIDDASVSEALLSVTARVIIMARVKGRVPRH